MQSISYMDKKEGGGEPKTNKQTDNFVVTYPFRKLNSGNCHICRFSFIMCLLSLSLKAPLACYLKCQNNLQQACQHPFIGDNSFGGGGGRRIQERVQWLDGVRTEELIHSYSLLLGSTGRNQVRKRLKDPQQAKNLKALLPVFFSHLCFTGLILLLSAFQSGKMAIFFQKLYCVESSLLIRSCWSQETEKQHENLG